MKKDRARLTYGTVFSVSYGRLVMVLAGTALLTAGNVYLRWSIGEALDTGKLHMSLLAVAGALLILAQAVSYIRQILFVKIQKNLFGRIQSKVLHGSMESLGRNDLGAVTALYTADVGQIDSFANRIVGKAFPDLAGWGITLGLLFWFDLYLGIASILVTVLPAIFLHRMSRPIAKGTGEYQEALEDANQSVITGLYNMESIKASCREENFLRDNEEKQAILQKKKRKVAIWEALLGVPMLVSAFGTVVLLTALSGWLVLQGRITAGQLLTVVTLTDNIVTFVMSLDNTISVTRRASVSLQRLNAFLEEDQEREGGEEVGQIREIAFRNIRFAYPCRGGMEGVQSMKGIQSTDEVQSMEQERSIEDRSMEGVQSMDEEQSMEGTLSGEIYHGFSETWQRGNLYYVKGGNGEGKSTLIKLLMGIYDLLSGEILINGISSRQYSLTSLREKIVAVPQENVLFQGSIRDNLACGKEVSPQRMEEVCRKTGIHEEILRMPDGYETVLTENGGVLSGGQKQRLCLARALLREGEVYIFDEPTAALDKGNRERFAALLEELCKDRIVVVITHEKELLDGARRVTQIGGSGG